MQITREKGTLDEQCYIPFFLPLNRGGVVSSRVSSLLHFPAIPSFAFRYCGC